MIDNLDDDIVDNIYTRKIAFLNYVLGVFTMWVMCNSGGLIFAIALVVFILSTLAIIDIIHNLYTEYEVEQMVAEAKPTMPESDSE